MCPFFSLPHPFGFFIFSVLHVRMDSSSYRTVSMLPSPPDLSCPTLASGILYAGACVCAVVSTHLTVPPPATAAADHVIAARVGSSGRGLFFFSVNQPSTATVFVRKWYDAVMHGRGIGGSLSPVEMEWGASARSTEVWDTGKEIVGWLGSLVALSSVGRIAPDTSTSQFNRPKP